MFVQLDIKAPVQRLAQRDVLHALKANSQLLLVMTRRVKMSRQVKWVESLPIQVPCQIRLEPHSYRLAALGISEQLSP